MLSKEECLEAVRDLKDLTSFMSFNIPKHNMNAYLLEQLINEHFDNPPLKFEELQRIHKKAVWDNKAKEWVFMYQSGNSTWFLSCDTDYDEKLSYEENRFFLKEVKE